MKFSYDSAAALQDNMAQWGGLLKWSLAYHDGTRDVSEMKPLSDEVKLFCRLLVLVHTRRPATKMEALDAGPASRSIHTTRKCILTPLRRPAGQGVPVEGDGIDGGGRD